MKYVFKGAVIIGMIAAIPSGVLEDSPMLGCMALVTALFIIAEV